MTTRRIWTPAMDSTLLAQYPMTLTSDLAKSLGMSLNSVYFRAWKLGVKKSIDFVKENARQNVNSPGHGSQASRFQKGHTTWNRGVKGIVYEGMIATQFKPGMRPMNWVPIGSTRIVNSNLERKVSELRGGPHLRWHPIHRIVWIAANGPVPAGHIIVFKAGMHTAVESLITLDRLECITRAENVRRNHPGSACPELYPLVALRAAITRQINKRQRDIAGATGVTT